MRHVLVFLMCLFTTSTFAAEPVPIEAGVVVVPAEGWQQVPSAKGVGAQFGIPGDDKTRIEYRSVTLETDEQAERFFRSYHANLVSTGLKEVKPSEKKTYGAISGVETHYSGVSKDGEFSLVLFQFTHKQRAWLLVGFATGKRSELMREAFEVFAAGTQTK